MPVRIQATRIQGRDLKPGDLFSTVGTDYWNQFETRDSVGERVYIRTNAPANMFPDANEFVYRIKVIQDAASTPGN